MIKEFVQRWEARKHELEADFRKEHVDSYFDLVRKVTQIVTTDNYSYDEGAPDPERIHEINDGYYQGTLLYVIAEKGYQPRTYYSVFIDYGSCSGCDTLQSICDMPWHNNDGNKSPTDSQVQQYMTLALHIVQGLKRIE